jgi:anti-sigma regulatory factor (Ser/Thr protein kinase)
VGSATILVPSVSVELPAVATSVAVARAAIRAFAAGHGASAWVEAAVALATSEAATNAVLHAYPGDRAGTIWLDADVEDDELEVVVADDGRGFVRPDHPRPGLGWGLALMREHSSAFQVRDRPLGGVEVWMRFALTAAG